MFRRSWAFTDLGISLTVLLQLEADGVRVEVPSASIHEGNPDYRLGQIYVYPFMGATRGGARQGYMLIPNGTGSLIRFAETTKAKNMFYGRYRDRLGDEGHHALQRTAHPIVAAVATVFGIAHDDQHSAFLSIIEKGSAYGELQVHPSGIITNFNFLYNAFIYNEAYFQATNRSGAGVTAGIEADQRL